MFSLDEKQLIIEELDYINANIAIIHVSYEVDDINYST